MASLIQLHPSFDSLRSFGVRGPLSVRVHPAAELSEHLSMLVDSDVPDSPRARRSAHYGARTINWALRLFRFPWSGAARDRHAARRSRSVGLPSGDAVPIQLRSPILPGSAPDRARSALFAVRSDAAGYFLRPPSGAPVGETVPTSAPDCATLYCARHSIRPHRFVSAVFWKTLYPHARWFGFPIIVLLPWTFARDRDFLAEVGRVRTLKQYAAVEEGFHRWSEPWSFLRGALRLRVSTRRVRRLVEGLIVRPRSAGPAG